MFFTSPDPLKYPIVPSSLPQLNIFFLVLQLDILVNWDKQYTPQLFFPQYGTVLSRVLFLF